MEDACQAARDGRLQYFEALEDGKVTALLRQTDEDGRTLLHNAVAGKNSALAKWILGHGAECNTADDEGWTPLHTAASIGNMVAVDILLDAGAAADPRNSFGCTPLHYAVASQPHGALLSHSYSASSP